MNKIISFLICFQLILLPQAFAQGTVPEGVGGMEGINAGELPPGLGTTYDPLAKSKPGAEETSGGDMDCSNCGGIDFYTQQVFVMALSTVGSTIITQCSLAVKSPSMWAFIAASVAHITSELMIGKSLQDRYKAKYETLDIDNTELQKYSKGDSKQLDALKSAKAEEEALLAFLETRKWMTAGIMGALALAAVIAFLETAKYVSPAGIVADVPTNDIGCNPINFPKAKYAATALNAVIAALYSFVMSHNTKGNITVYGGLLLLVLNLCTVPIQKGVMLTFASPIARGITFSSLTLLEFPLLMGLFVRESSAEENIKKLDAVIQNFELVETPEGYDPDDRGLGGDPSGVGGGDRRNGRLTAMQTIQLPPGPCEIGDPKICGQILRPLNQMEYDFGEYGALRDGLQSAVNFSNSLYRGNIADAKLHATKLANQAGTYRKIGEALKKKINQKFKDQGKPQIDFDKETKNRLKSFQDDFNKVLVANNKAPMQDLTASRAATLAKPEMIGNRSNYANQILKSGGSSTRKRGDNNLFSNDEDEEEISPQNQELKKSGDNLDKYDVEEADINKKSDVSIFVQLSNRYILNYNKIFKTLPPPPPNAKK